MVFEEIKIDSVENLIDFYTSNPLKGEIVAMLYAQNNEKTCEVDVLKIAQKLLKEGFSNKDTVKIMVSLYGLKKNDIYKILN